MLFWVCDHTVSALSGWDRLRPPGEACRAAAAPHRKEVAELVWAGGKDASQVPVG